MAWRCANVWGNPSNSEELCYCLKRKRQDETIEARKKAITTVLQKLAKDMVAGRVKATLKNGKLEFVGWDVRENVGTESAVGFIMAGDNAQAKMLLLRAMPGLAQKQAIAR